MSLTVKISPNSFQPLNGKVKYRVVIYGCSLLSLLISPSSGLSRHKVILNVH